MAMTLQERVKEFNRRISQNPDLIAGPAEKLFNAETDYLISSTLAESYKLCNMKVLPPSLGVIMLLTCVNSPFVTGEGSPCLKDVCEALFIIKFRNRLGGYILHKKEKEAVLARLEHEARGNPAIYGVYMDRLLSAKPSKYDQLLAEFSEGLTEINLSQAILDIGRYLGAPLKKNSRSRTSAGLLGMLQKCLARTSITFSGK